jgi:hypothetical protein
VHERLRHAEQAARPRRRDQRLLRPGRLRAGHQHAPLLQVRAVRAPGLRPARSETGDTREVTVSKSLLEAYEREHEKYCKELEAYCTKYALPFFRTHTAIPFDELVLRIFRSGGFLR